MGTKSVTNKPQPPISIHFLGPDYSQPPQKVPEMGPVLSTNCFALLLQAAPLANLDTASAQRNTN